MTIFRTISILISGLILGMPLVQAEDFKPLPGQTAVKVCADGFNLPYSNKELEGFDNKIAAIIGEELGLPVEYTWFPQRIGFSRNTIKKVDPKTGLFLCDLAMSMPDEKSFVTPTKSYFSSIEALVYRSGEGYEISQVSDIATLKKDGKELKIGIFDRGVATESLLKNGLGDQVKYYQFMPGDARVNAGRIVKAVADGEVDVAFLWGPIAGYYATQQKVKITVQPLNELGADYIFSFGMGVRHQDKKWQKILDKILVKRKDDITAILAEYSFPSLENVKASTKKKKEYYKVVDGKVDDKTYVGWRLFNSTCFVCHGQNATGTDIAPNLLTAVEGMSEFRFRKKVLHKYFAKVNLDDPDRRLAFLEQVSAQAAKEFKMPTWSDDPNIRPHISDLYAYLKARSDGALGVGRPERLH
jgi:quinoprotein dehydrogenase-associated probable ABC transporter substrate-binding protein